MTNNLITLTIPNDDHVALRAFGKALEEMALAHGAKPQAQTLVRERVSDLEVEYLTRNAVAAKVGVTMEELDSVMQVDTTTQQVESLATNVVNREVEFNNPPPETSDATTDNSGTPWDDRIHSASKALNSDGTWRLRRKPKDMDDMEWSDYVTMIKADLQYPVECGGEEIDQEHYAAETVDGLNEIPEPPVTLEEAVNASIEATHASIAQEFGTDIANAAFTGDRVTPPGDDFHTDASVVTEQIVAGIPPIPVPPPVVVPPVTEEWTFPKLMTFLTERQGKIDVATVNMLLAQDGIASLPELNAHPGKIGPFVARVKAHLGE